MENTEYKKRNLALTRTTVCPAVLVETGYMSNPQEYQYLINAENRKRWQKNRIMGRKVF